MIPYYSLFFVLSLTTISTTIALLIPRCPSTASFHANNHLHANGVWRSITGKQQDLAILSMNNKDEDNELEEGQKQSADYKEKLAELDDVIAKAEKERQSLLQTELDRYEKEEKDIRSKSNIGKKETEDEEPDNLVPVGEWTPRQLKMPPPPASAGRIDQETMPFPSSVTSSSFSSSFSDTSRPMTTRSKVTRSDAGTLVIEITPQGITSGVVFNGVFSVAWFSAIVPATLAAFSGAAGLGFGLFLLPFWAAGGMVAKQAVVDPFISNKLSIGQFAYSVESLYANARSIQKRDGSTDNLQGAKVDVPVVVNGVPQYQLSLYDSSKGVITLGQGLPGDELQKVADEINQYLESLSSSSSN